MKTVLWISKKQNPVDILHNLNMIFQTVTQYASYHLTITH